MKPATVYRQLVALVPPFYRQLVALVPPFSQEVLLSICVLLADLTLYTILLPTFVFLKIFIKSFSSITLSSLNNLETLHKKNW